MRRLSALTLNPPVRPKQRGDRWIFRTPRASLVSGMLFSGLVILIIVVGSVGTVPTGLLIFFLVVAAYWVWAVVRGWGSGIDATAEGVRFIGMLRSRRVRWQDITRFEFGEAGYRAAVQAVCKDGTIVKASSLAQGNMYTKPETNRSKLQATLDKLNELLREHQDEGV